MIEVTQADVRRLAVYVLPLPLSATLGLFSEALGWLFLLTWFEVLIGWKLGSWIRWELQKRKMRRGLAQLVEVLDRRSSDA